MNEVINGLLDKTGLNWTVRQDEIQTVGGIVIPDKKAIVREDTNQVLDVMGDGYYPYQNHELMELLYQVSNKTGLEVHRGGSFKDGARVYVQLKSEDLKLGNDRIEGFLPGINSFDGSTSLAFGHSNVTISCQNKFFSAFRQVQNKIRHTKSMSIRIDEICKRLDVVLEEEQSIYRHIVELSETTFDDLMKERVTRKLFGIKPEINLNDQEAISTQTRNKMSKFYIDLNGEIQSKGDNLWGLFSGVTKYTTHSYTKNDITAAKMYGRIGQIEQEIFSNLVEMV